MSITQIDHVVIAVKDLDQAIADYTALGFTVTPGGKHTSGATHNALVVFEDGSYFELIAFLKPNEGFRWWHSLQDHGESIVDFALFPTEIEKDIPAARERGVEYTGPTPLGRNRPDGVRLDWFLGHPGSRDLPFLCGDVTPRELRVPEGDVRKHANGVTGIASITIAVADINVSAARYRGLLGLEAAGGSNQALAIPGTNIDTAIFQISNSLIVLASSTDPNSELAQRVATRGEGPHAVALRVPGGAPNRKLDLGLTHGALLELVSY
jgi:catechol 2,3-dioxygenase-like lactoylglutathione lyase family enzyme